MKEKPITIKKIEDKEDSKFYTVEITFNKEVRQQLRGFVLHYKDGLRLEMSQLKYFTDLKDVERISRGVFEYELNISIIPHYSEPVKKMEEYYKGLIEEMLGYYDLYFRKIPIKHSYGKVVKQ